LSASLSAKQIRIQCRHITNTSHVKQVCSGGDNVNGIDWQQAIPATQKSGFNTVLAARFGASRTEFEPSPGRTR
jgi:hypothetical protein